MRRRVFLPAAGGAVLAGCSRAPEGPPGNSAVAILKAASYSAELTDLLTEGARLCGLDVRDKRVLVKPNLVEFDHSTCINTHAAVAAAAVGMLERLGAAEVLVGEGPGHRRDTLYVAGEVGYRKAVPRFDARFVDLNRDDVARVAPFADEPGIYLPKTALGADLIISLAKMKTHHWAGATLSMKNLFGLVPGAVYGWPKNRLHHVGIHRSIVELNRIFRRTFAIVDGIVGMEGNGPVHGAPKPCGTIVMGADLVAVDATCCRIMGIAPQRIEYLAQAEGLALGRAQEARIEQRGETVASVRNPFSMIREFRFLQRS